SPAWNTPTDYFRGSKQTAPSATPRNLILREKLPSSFLHLQSRSWPQSSGPGNGQPWPRRSSPELDPRAWKWAKRCAGFPNRQNGWCHPCRALAKCTWPCVESKYRVEEHL